MAKRKGQRSRSKRVHSLNKNSKLKKIGKGLGISGLAALGVALSGGSSEATDWRTIFQVQEPAKFEKANISNDQDQYKFRIFTSNVPADRLIKMSQPVFNEIENEVLQQKNVQDAFAILSMLDANQQLEFLKDPDSFFAKNSVFNTLGINSQMEDYSVVKESLIKNLRATLINQLTVNSHGSSW